MLYWWHTGCHPECVPTIHQGIWFSYGWKSWMVSEELTKPKGTLQNRCYHTLKSDSHKIVLRDLTCSECSIDGFWDGCETLIFFFPMFPFDLPEDIRKPKVLWSPWKHQKTKSFQKFSGEWKGNIGKKRIKTNWYSETNITSLCLKKLNALIWEILKTWTLKMMRMLSSMMMMIETNESDESDEEKRRNLILLMWSGLNMVGFGILIKYIVSMVRVNSSTNWPPFTGGQNPILNWVLKLNPLNQKIKK